MAGHGVGPQQLHAVDDILALGAVGAERTLQGVAAVEQKNAVLAARGAHRLHRRRHAVEAADAAVGFRQRGEIFGR